MSRRTKRSIFVSLLVAITAAFGLYVALPAKTIAKAQALADVGSFRVGHELGLERAGFSGRPMVIVFASADSPDWPAIQACLQSSEVAAEIASGFTGVIVDETAEPKVEPSLRESFRVIVRGLHGAMLGGLKAGFACADLSALLKQVSATANSPPEMSPIYARLLESSGAVDALNESGASVGAAKYVEFLRELEGAESPAVKAAEARLVK